MDERPARHAPPGRLAPRSRAWSGPVGTIGALLGWTALQTVLSLPANSRYVTFTLTPDRLWNGGWATSHTGGDSGAYVVVPPNAIDAGLFRVALWAAVVLGAAMLVPSVLVWFRRR